LAAIAEDDRTPPPRRLRAWLHAVLATKQEKIRTDPELFAAFGVLAAEHSSVASDHVADLLGQLQSIVAAGASDGSFGCADPVSAARTVFHATARFHHIALASSWLDPGIEAELDAVCTLLLAGLASGLASGDPA